VRAASLNFHELAIVVRGEYPLPIEAHLIPASDGAGEVVAVGEGIGRVRVGDRVVGSVRGACRCLRCSSAKLHGARAIATTSSADKARRLTALGADAVVNYRAVPDWHAVRELTWGRGRRSRGRGRRARHAREFDRLCRCRWPHQSGRPSGDRRVFRFCDVPEAFRYCEAGGAFWGRLPSAPEAFGRRRR
jgi:threonine dehydrogenase-like Zn-dependent dehydrogenase